MAKKTPIPESLGHFLEGMRYADEKAAKAAEAERQKPLLRTPQNIRATTNKGRKWLESPPQAALYEANQLAHYFFHVACALMDPSQKEHRAHYEARVFEVRHRLAIVLDDSPKKRRKQQLIVFLGEFREQLERCEQARQIYLQPDDPAELSSDPGIAAIRKAEREARGVKLARSVFGRTARQAMDYFSRIYPEDGALLSHEKLTAALRSAVELRARSQRGRRKENAPGLYQLLSESIAKTAFAAPAKTVQRVWDSRGGTRPEKPKKSVS